MIGRRQQTKNGGQQKQVLGSIKASSTSATKSKSCTSSILSLLLGISSVITVLTSVINFHLLSQVVQDNNKINADRTKNDFIGLGKNLGEPLQKPQPFSSSSSLQSSQSQRNLFSGYLENGTYWTNDVNDPSYIDVQYSEVSLKNPPLPDGNSSFSACLLVMDDNHRLVEWLAYHYHVLPLRFLIITIDPRSRTKPTHVLNRWREMGMFILEWNDFDFLKLSLARNPIPDDARLEDKRARHRIRQRQFFRKCLEVSKTYDRTYVALTDTDEYIMYNHKGGDGFEKWEQQQVELAKKNKDTRGKQRIWPSQPPPTPDEEGGLIKYIRQEEAAGIHPSFQGPCISSPRLQISAIEDNSTTKPDSYKYGDVIDIDRFETLRFHKHGPRQEFVNNRLAKAILDVSRIDRFPDMETLHRPIKTICPPPWRNEWDSALRIYHYLGTWEAYTFRDDARRGGEHSKELWYFKSAEFASETDDLIVPWMDGFIKKHGPQKTKELLQGAGLPRDFINPIGHNYTYDYRHLHQVLNSTTRQDSNKKEMQLAFDKFVLQMHNVT